MKIYRFILFSAALSLCALSCVKENDFGKVDEGVEMTFTAVCDNDISDPDDPAVKTKLTGTQVRWVANDAISLFSKAGAGSTFTAKSVSTTTAAFTGTLTPGAAYYAIYPAQTDAALGNNGEISVTLPTVQTATANSFGPGANLAAAYTPSADNYLSFKNVGGILQLIVRNTGIASIRIDATEAGGNSMTGKSVIAFNEGVPVVKSTSGVGYAELTGTINSGQRYNFVVYPGKYSNVTLTFTTKDGRTAVYTNPKMVLDVKRNSITKIADLTIPDDRFEDDTPIYVSQIASSPSTATVTWTTFKEDIESSKAPWPNKETGAEEHRNADCAKDYTLTLYSDANCATQVVKYVCDNYYKEKGGAVTSRIFDKNYPTRFTFSGLNPSSTYYLKIANTTDGTEMKRALAITTTAHAFEGTVPEKNAKVGDVILFESFDGCLFGGDISHFAAGYSRYDRGTNLPSDFYSLKAHGTIPGTADDNFYLAYSNVELELFTSCKNILSSMGLDDWGFTSDDGAGGSIGSVKSVLCRPGYLKLGGSNLRGRIVTPKLANLPAGYTATVRVSFKAAPYTSSSALDLNEGAVSVKVANGGTLESSHNVSGLSYGNAKSITIESTLPEWKEYSVELAGLTSNSRIEIGGNRGGGKLTSSTQNRFHIDDIKVEVVSLEDYSGNAFKGTVKDNSGNPIEGVSVTDGFTVVSTRADGTYIIPYNSKAEFVYITVPAEYQVKYDSYGFSNSYIKADGYSKDYNFTLTPIPGGKQARWNFLTLADPQTKESTSLALFNKEVVPDIKSFAAGYDNLYGVILGDICWNSAASHWPNMRDALATGKTGVHWFPVMGNHDWYNSNSDSSPKADTFKKYYGPNRFSVDRGDVHIVCINNCIANGTGGEVKGGFTDDEFKWLENDLALVPKSKAVIICTHIAFRSGGNEDVHCVYHGETLNLLTRFASAYLMSGHSHYNHWYHHNINGKYIQERVHTAGCGGYWHGKVGCDGSPGGYTIYTFEGTRIVDYITKCTGKDASYQIRCYDGNSYRNGTYLKPYGWQMEKGYIVANVFAADPSSPNKWTVELYQDGVKICDMSNVTSSMVKNVTYENVAKFNGTKDIAQNRDWWTWNEYVESGSNKKNYSGGTWSARYNSTSYQVDCSHLFYGKLKTIPSNMKDAKFEVRATDPFGNVYTCTTLTAYSEAGSSLVWR